MGVQMTEQQFQALLARLAPVPAGVMAVGAASVVGQLAPCTLGRNKLKRFKKFVDWTSDAESKMNFLGIRDNDQKINFIRSCAGPELTQFWEKEARVRFESVQANQDLGIEALDAHTYAEIITESKNTLLKIINPDRAIIDMMRMTQGDKTFMEYLAVVEDQEHLCRADEERITGDDLKRMSLIAGMKDRKLAEKCIGEEYTLKQVIQAGVNRENSKANVEAMQAKSSTQIKRLADCDVDERINFLQAELEDVMCIRKNGKYSGRFKHTETGTRDKCPKCTYDHDKERRCPAESRECNKCGETGHFARSSICKAVGGKKEAENRRVEEDTASESSDDTDGEEGEQTLRRMIDSKARRQWPGVKKNSKVVRNVHYVSKSEGRSSKRSRWVTLDVGGSPLKLYSDTGSHFTIIPPELFKDGMGRLEEADCNLRAWGANTYLDVKGMFSTKLTNSREASKTTMVYMVGGTRPEPLLGDADAEDLGIISFNPEGREAMLKDKQKSNISRFVEKKTKLARVFHLS